MVDAAGVLFPAPVACLAALRCVDPVQPNPLARDSDAVAVDNLRLAADVLGGGWHRQQEKHEKKEATADLG